MFRSYTSSPPLWIRLACVILLAREPPMSFAQQASPSPGTVATVSEATLKDTTADNLTLDSLLKHDGFMVVKLKQVNLDKYPKRLVVDVEINQANGSF